MNDLRDVLAAMLHGDGWDGCTFADCDVQAESVSDAERMLITPQGRALAALVEAALAWSGPPLRYHVRVTRSREEEALHRAIDAYREATR